MGTSRAARLATGRGRGSATRNTRRGALARGRVRHVWHGRGFGSGFGRAGGSRFERAGGSGFGFVRRLEAGAFAASIRLGCRRVRGSDLQTRSRLGCRRRWLATRLRRGDGSRLRDAFGAEVDSASGRDGFRLTCLRSKRRGSFGWRTRYDAASTMAGLRRRATAAAAVEIGGGG